MSTQSPDPEIRKTTPEEIAELTGYSAHLIRRAGRAGLLVEMGVIYVPSETSSEAGSYMCALKPFLNWFRGDAIVARQSATDSTNAIAFLRKTELVKSLLSDVA